jgi:hypothetical protein
MANQILHRRDTAANWTATNPVLGAGEIGVESDTNTFKLGDGTTAWASLDYFSGGGGSEIDAVATYTVGAGGDFATVAALSEYFLAQRHATAWEVSGNNRQRAGFITVDLQGLNHDLGTAYISFEWFGSWLVFTNGAIGNGTLVFTNTNVRFANAFAAGYAGNTLGLQANGAFLFDSNDDTNSFSNLSVVYINRGSYLQIWNAYTNPVVATGDFTADTGSVIYVASNTFNCRSIYSYDDSHVHILPSTSPELSNSANAISAARHSSVQIDNHPVSAAAGRLSVSLGSSVIFDAPLGINLFGNASGTSTISMGSSVKSRTDLTVSHALSVTSASTVEVVGTATVSGVKTVQDSSALIDSTNSVELHPGLPTSDPSISNALWSSSGVLMLSGGTPPSSYTNADVDTHLNTSTATANQVLEWDGADYAWVDQSASLVTSADPLNLTAALGSAPGRVNTFEFNGNLTDAQSAETWTFTGTASYANDRNSVASSALTLGSGERLYKSTPLVGPNDTAWFVGFWFKSDGTSFPSNGNLFGTGFTSNLLHIGTTLTNSTTASLSLADYTSGWTRVVATIQPVWTDWNHYALQRNGNVLQLFLNGALVATGSAAGDTYPDEWYLGHYTGTMQGDYDQLYIHDQAIITNTSSPFNTDNPGGGDVKVGEIDVTGNTTDSTMVFKQYESGVLTSYPIYKDSSVDAHLNTSTATANQVLSWSGSDYVWTDDQTGGAPSGPNPTLLLKGDVSVTQDDSLNGYTFTTTGAPVLDTGDKQFGAGSIDFPTASKITTNETLNFGTGSFCIEAWLKPDSVSGTVYWASKPATGNFCWLFVNQGVPGIHYAGAGRNLTSSLSTSAWNHVAFVFDGTNLKGYFNGVEEYTAVDSSDLGDFVWAFGGTDAGVSGSGSWYDGGIDDLRVTLGDPVYTGAFTPAEHPIPVANPLGTDETDVTITSPANGEVLTYNGSQWVNAAGGGSLWTDNTTYYNAAVDGIVVGDAGAPNYVNANYPGITIYGNTGASVNFLNSIGTLQGRLISNQNNLQVRPGSGNKVFLEDQNGQNILTSDGATGRVTFGDTNSYTLPAARGTDGQTLVTNATGDVSWASAGGGGGSFDPTENQIVLGTHDLAPDVAATTSIAIGSSQYWYAGNTGIMMGFDTQNNGTNNIVIGNLTKLQGSCFESVCIGNEAGDGITAQYSVLIGHKASDGSLKDQRNAININASGAANEVAGQGGVVLQTTKAKMEYSDASGWVFTEDIGGTNTTYDLSSLGGGGGGDAADLYDKGWTSKQGKTDTGVDFDLTTEDFWFEIRVFVDSAASYQNLFTLGGDGGANGLLGQFQCYKTNSRGITMIHSTNGDDTNGTLMFNNDEAGQIDDSWVVITIQRESNVVTGWINGTRHFTTTPTAFTGDNTGGKIWLWTYADGTVVQTFDKCRISDFRFEVSPTIMPYVASDLTIEPTLGSPPALPAIDESGRIETNDWLTTSNASGEDRFLFKASDGAGATPTWRGQASGGFQFNIGSTNESITFSEGNNAVEITGRHSVSGGVEGLRINGIGGGTAANQTVFIATNGTDRMEIRGTNIIMPTLPTSDPLIAGALWNDSGTLKVSAG